VVEQCTINLISPTIKVAQWPVDCEHFIEKAARTCYRSEPVGSREKFLKTLIAKGHESVLEHCGASVIITCSRSCSHQLVRHRLGAYSQESQRYVNYGKKSIQFIRPPEISPGVYGEIAGNNAFIRTLLNAVKGYNELLASGWKPEDAREVLPNCTVTRVFTTFNLRQWRHVFQERALNSHAQKQIREIMSGILREFAARTYLFDDLVEKL